MYEAIRYSVQFRRICYGEANGYNNKAIFVITYNVVYDDMYVCTYVTSQLYI